jgi:PAP2 superfamily
MPTNCCVHRILRRLYFFLSALIFLLGLKAQQKENILYQLNDLLVNTAMDDLFTPPVCSRIYTYPNIAFYECIRFDEPMKQPLSGKLNGLKKLPAPEKGNNNFISACIAFSFVAQNFVGTEYKIEEWRSWFVDSIQNTVTSPAYKTAYDYGKRIADSIIAWSKKDNYLKSRGMMRFTASEKDGTWQPTPNDYAPGLEPHWNVLRPMIMRSPSQFSPTEKLKYSSSKQSLFYKNVLEVYSLSKKMDSNQIKIAWYWDDNPNVSVIEGHLTYFVHKISPGGHWIKIAGQACKQKNISLVKTAQLYALTSIAIYEAFIACWDEKYKTNLIRPITVINNHIDADWRPLIQTPPFPEFTSGHSVTSNAAAAVLTFILGDNFSFTDETEIPFGHQPKTFRSFNEAAKESSMSRVYGGIHYPETARISILQGQKIGKYVIQSLYTTMKSKL